MEVKTVVKKTAIRKREVVLPIRPEIMFIPNRVTNAKYNYTLIQEKIFNYVLFNLQEAIKLSLNGKDYSQLKLFKDINEDRISITVPMRNIAGPNHYPDVREAAENLAKSIIRIVQVNKDNGQREMRSLTLFGAVVTPMDKTRNSEIKIEMSKEVSRLLVEMDINKVGMPSNYTSFDLQVVNRAKNKYTPRIYKKIESWKEKGGFYMTLAEFRDWLDLGDKYQKYAEIKRNILVPVQEELEGKALCWFNCKEKSFEKRQGKEVVGLSFKVITPEFEEMKIKQADNIKDLLIRHLGFKAEHLAQVECIFTPRFDFNKMSSEVLRLHAYVQENSKEIGNKQAYLIKCLLKDFSPTKND
ncbi:RepB family plasmid replication initiator protein [Segetibacter sp. 3557_3]|uniref:replication initiation protein n=1 Tax=Segetibacter sp. 3557_3 TaxID=2547429 RepID=UPI0010590B68|nr:replication initiation protein [Segetibacter sp. 3557_3]TDH18062.1 RepB family plasmid replication initiator protein [Segetibacter sp. 3557_3]